MRNFRLYFLVLATLCANANISHAQDKPTTEAKSTLSIIEITTNENQIKQGYTLFTKLRKGVSADEFVKRAMKAQDCNYHLYYAYEDKEVVGILGFSYRMGIMWDLHVHVDTLLGRDGPTKRGIEKELLQHAESIARQITASKISVMTGIDKKETARFLDKAGYERSAVEFRKTTPVLNKPE